MRRALTFGGVVAMSAPLAALGAGCGPDLDGALDETLDASLVDATFDASPPDTAPPPPRDAASDGDATAQGDGAPADAHLDAPHDAPPPVDGGPCLLGDGGAGITCGSACVDPENDHEHCGSCNACAAQASCDLGACVDVAASLLAFRYEQPCTSTSRPFCATSSAVATKTAAITGTAGRTYAIRVHVRGVVEQKSVNGAAPGGATGTNSGFFVVGGTPPLGDAWNTYSLAGSAPALKVFLNAGTSGHVYCDAIDYHATIQANASSTLTFTCDPGDALEAPNVDPSTGKAIVIVGIPPAPQAFDGQFVQIDVESVRAL